MIDFFKKEIEVVAMDFVGYATDPNDKPKTNFTDEQLASGTLVFNKTKGCWCLERKTKGKIIGDYFVPKEGQSVKYKIKVPESGKFTKPE